MCLSANNLIFILLVPFIYAQQSDVRIARCLEKGSGDCLINVAENMVEKAEIPDKLEIFPGISLIRSNRTARGMNDLTNRTISFDVQEMTKKLSSGKNDGRSKKRRILYAVIATSILVAKAAAVVVSSSILIPLAIGSIALLGSKALFVAMVGVAVAGVFGLARLFNNGPESKVSELFLDDDKKRIDHAIQQGYMVVKREPPSQPSFLQLFRRP